MKTTTFRLILVLVAVFMFCGQSFAAKEINKDDRFIAYDDGTVLDTKTGLMWAAKDNGANINWESAKSFCEKYQGAAIGTGECLPVKSSRGCMTEERVLSYVVPPMVRKN